MTRIEGPFGVPMTDVQAMRLEAIVRALPQGDAFEPRRKASARGLDACEGRCDVSWITEETPDRVGDVVLASGIDDSHFRLNPLVTLNHDYRRPPVGRSVWRRLARDGALVGVQAKTHYPARPASWSDGPWPPDAAFDLVQAGLLWGKSIGFLPLQLREPTAEERRTKPGWANVRHVVERWLLLEYACCFLPMQPHSVVAEVSSCGEPCDADGHLARAWDAVARRSDRDDQIAKIVRSVLTRTQAID